MVSFANASLFEQDSVTKKLHIRFDSTQITNAEVYAEEFELTESLCSKDRLTFGSCEAAVVKFKVGDVYGSLKGKTLTISLEVGGAELPLGVFKVDSDRPDADRNYREVVAYDKMADILNADVTTWYNGRTFPMTLKNFRDSFFSYMGISQETTTLVNDNIYVKKTMDSKVLSGKTVITAICEINGVFGHMSRQGVFQYKSLETMEDGLFPSDDLLPSDILFPKNINSYNIYSGMRISAACEDYKTQKISKLVIRGETDDIGKTIGTGINAYVIEGNPLAWDKSSSELTTMGNNLFNKIKNVTYKPCEITLVGNPCVEVGDAFVTTGANQRIESYVLERTLKGVQALFDTYVANGRETYDEKVNAVEESIIRLNGKGNTLKRSVDGLESTVFDAQGNSRITQLSNQIQLKVSKGDIASSINLNEQSVKIQGTKLSLEGLTTINNTFAVDADGNVSITGGSIAIETSSESDDKIKLTYEGSTTWLTPISIGLADAKYTVEMKMAWEDEYNYCDFGLVAKPASGYGSYDLVRFIANNAVGKQVKIGDSSAHTTIVGSDVYIDDGTLELQATWKKYGTLTSNDYVLVG